jgi:Na+/melibiose symporter-like transporter
LEQKQNDTDSYTYSVAEEHCRTYCSASVPELCRELAYRLYAASCGSELVVSSSTAEGVGHPPSCFETRGMWVCVCVCVCVFRVEYVCIRVSQEKKEKKKQQNNICVYIYVNVSLVSLCFYWSVLFLIVQSECFLCDI